MNIHELTKEYLGVPYKLGGKTPSEGMDCFSLLLAAIEEKGDCPDEFEGVPFDSYEDAWMNDRENTKKKLIRFVASIGNEIPAGKAFAGDILIVKRKVDGQLAIGIHAGGNLILTAVIDEGIKLFNLSGFEIRRAYRWA